MMRFDRQILCALPKEATSNHLNTVQYPDRSPNTRDGKACSVMQNIDREQDTFSPIESEAIDQLKIEDRTPPARQMVAEPGRTGKVPSKQQEGLAEANNKKEKEPTKGILQMDSSKALTIVQQAVERASKKRSLVSETQEDSSSTADRSAKSQFA
ncbi:hypothetical protein QJS10_CPA06g01211 [Acorus calamus]|uniref:Uncharacterized protein n=1 Tax=Acorus calamus TaxID=4465 RepID=A0AAV9EQB5_ACOCL|nr:hypothetical protein QJS10_CPA06g01211 [Acorus calamus]